MIIAVLVVFGLCLGSFVNALVWRLHEQAELLESKKAKSKAGQKRLQELSISKGRSMCPDCHHELAAKDLVPVLSWLSVKGECRYCHKPISAQYPIVELLTAGLFIASYIWWPMAFTHAQTAIFILWLGLLVGFMALIVYDVRWMLLPNRIMYPLSLLAVAQAVIRITTAAKPLTALLGTVLAVLVGGGIFYLLFQLSAGKWIGGGDVKLGWLLGLTAGSAARSGLFIFIAAIGGSLLAVPLLFGGKLKRTSTIPFGPFLIIGAIVVQLFGGNIIHWYQQNFINY